MCIDLQPSNCIYILSTRSHFGIKTTPGPWPLCSLKFAISPMLYAQCRIHYKWEQSMLADWTSCKKFVSYLKIPWQDYIRLAKTDTQLDHEIREYTLTHGTLTWTWRHCLLSYYFHWFSIATRGKWSGRGMIPSPALDQVILGRGHGATGGGRHSMSSSSSHRNIWKQK